ncbi:hypothetical protein BJ138DRAFT_1231703, partial [Hygrophoropsis aurantiaca]
PVPPPQAPTWTQAQQLIAAYSLLSPSSKAKVDGVIGNLNVPTGPTKANLAAVGQVLFEESREQPAASSSSYAGHEFSPLLIALARAESHIPLTLFTTKATLRLRSSSMLKLTKVYKDGAMTHVLDTAQFPDECLMDIVDYHEAYQRLLEFYQKFADPAVHKRWVDHYTFIARHENFRANFPALRAFDIEQRINYAIE